MEKTKPDSQKKDTSCDRQEKIRQELLQKEEDWEVARDQYRTVQTKTIRHFCDELMESYWKNPLQITTEEKKVLKLFTELYIASTQTPIRASVLPVKDILTKDKLNLKELWRLRSLVHNVLWLDLLHQNNQSTIGVIDENSQWKPDCYEFGVGSKFAPTQDQLAIINQFSQIASGYFTQDQCRKLLCMQNNFEDSWDLNSLEKKLPWIRGIEASYKIFGLGSRLMLLKKIASTRLKCYAETLDNSMNESHREILALISKNIQKSILSNIQWRCTFLMLTDLNEDMRESLLDFSSISLKKSAEGLTLKQNRIKELHKLPNELRQIILQYLLMDYISTAPIWQYQYDRMKILQYDLQFALRDRDSKNVEAISGMYAKYLLSYLWDIKEKEHVDSYSLIPYNESHAMYAYNKKELYRILF